MTDEIEDIPVDEDSGLMPPGIDDDEDEDEDSSLPPGEGDDD